MHKRKFTANVWPEGKRFVSQCLEVDVVSQGRSESTALTNLGDALALHFTPYFGDGVDGAHPITEIADTEGT